jgi:hypothetical protein
MVGSTKEGYDVVQSNLFQEGQFWGNFGLNTTLGI